MCSHCSDDFIWGDDLCSWAKAGYPCKKLRAYHHIGFDSKVCIAVGHQHHIMPESIKDSTHQTIFKAQFDRNLLTGEHAKDFPCVNSHIQRIKGVLSISLLNCGGDLCHLIHAVMLDNPSLAVVGDQIVILVIPGQRIWAYNIELAILSEMPGLLNSVFKVLELDLPVL